MPRLRFPAHLSVLLLLAPTGCVHRGFFTDGSSLSLGKSTRGALIHARELPEEGPGYRVPAPWVARGARYGVDELVEAIERAAARVEERVPGGLLGVGDLSSRHGGRAVHHKSHENGRDADLIFYSVATDGDEPLPPANAMPRYDRRLRGHPPREGPAEPLAPRRFDVPRNWALVAALLDDPTIAVEYLFVSAPLREALLRHAAGAGEADEVIARAKAALRSPGRRALPHDDHFHLRIRCPETDRSLGCVDEGRVRLRIETVPEPATS